MTIPDKTHSVERHLDYWLYGVVKVAGDLGNVRGFLRAVQEVTIARLLEKDGVRVAQGLDPVEALRLYNRHLDDQGFLDADDIAYHRKGGRLTVSVGESCPYRNTCNWLREDLRPIPCFRAIAMGEFLRLGTGSGLDGNLTKFGIPCHITFSKPRLQEAEHGD